MPVHMVITAMTGLTNPIAMIKPIAQYTAYISIHKNITIHTCNTLHRSYPDHSQHVPLHDLAGPLSSARADCMVIMIGGNECQ